MLLYAIRLARHEAYGFHSTAVIDNGCLRYRLLVKILGIICISEALLELEQPKRANWATRNAHILTTRRTLAADVKTLDASSNFPISKNKIIQKRAS